MSAKILFVPVGGLANRMRSIDSAIEFAKAINCKLTIIWFQDWGMGCPYNKLFEPIKEINVTIREATFVDKFLYDRPRKKNFFIPLFFQQFIFSKRIYEDQFDSLFGKKFDFRTLKKYKKLFIASFYAFYSVKKPFTILNPLAELSSRINQITDSFSKDTIGIHIRRTDNTLSIENSPITLFKEEMQKEINKNPQVNFYLATDSQEVKEEIIKAFPSKVKYMDIDLDRGSIKGIQSSLVELYILSKTKFILGSFSSSYTETAAQLSNIEYKIVRAT